MWLLEYRMAALNPPWMLAAAPRTSGRSPTGNLALIIRAGVPKPTGDGRGKIDEVSAGHEGGYWVVLTVFGWLLLIC